MLCPLLSSLREGAARIRAHWSVFCASSLILLLQFLAMSHSVTACITCSSKTQHRLWCLSVCSVSRAPALSLRASHRLWHTVQRTMSVVFIAFGACLLCEAVTLTHRTRSGSLTLVCTMSWWPRCSRCSSAGSVCSSFSMGGCSFPHPPLLFLSCLSRPYSDISVSGPCFEKRWLPWNGTW
jgi:hypothetical protein